MIELSRGDVAFRDHVRHAAEALAGITTDDAEAKACLEEAERIAREDLGAVPVSWWAAAAHVALRAKRYDEAIAAARRALADRGQLPAAGAPYRARPGEAALPVVPDTEARASLELVVAEGLLATGRAAAARPHWHAAVAGLGTEGRRQRTLALLTRLSAVAETAGETRDA